MPKVSVLMSVYNEPIEWLRHSIDSILNQTYKDFEFIVVNDNPNKKELKQILEDYSCKDTRFRLIENDVNIGLTKSLNKGLQVAQGKYIARMDGDDISEEIRLEKQVQYLDEHPDVIVLGTNIRYIGDVPKFKLTDSIKFTNEDIKAHLLYCNCIVHPSVMIRKKILDDNNISYDDNYRHSQDYRLWEQLYKHGKFINLKEKLLNYRISTSQITKANSLSQEKFSNEVSIRLQMKWLEQNDISVSYKELRCALFEIIENVRKNAKIRRSKEYHAFLQYFYLSSYQGKIHRKDFFLRDFRYLSFFNCLRFVRQLFTK